jgi:hypothetical protein
MAAQGSAGARPCRAPREEAAAPLAGQIPPGPGGVARPLGGVPMIFRLFTRLYGMSGSRSLLSGPG